MKITPVELGEGMLVTVVPSVDSLMRPSGRWTQPARPAPSDTIWSCSPQPCVSSLTWDFALPLASISCTKYFVARRWVWSGLGLSKDVVTFVGLVQGQFQNSDLAAQVPADTGTAAEGPAADHSGLFGAPIGEPPRQGLSVDTDSSNVAEGR